MAKPIQSSASKSSVIGDEAKVYTGRCLCGQVTFTANNLSDIWYCHCKQCQKLTGLYIAAAGCLKEDIEIKGPMNWLPISDKSNSGHCASCGCYMFWDMPSRPTISVLPGCIDDTAGLEPKGHIFVSEKPDFYEITDALPQFETYPEGVLRS